MNELEFLNLNPVIPVDDMDKTLEFYNKLGFQNMYDSSEYEEGQINYLVLCRDHICLHFQLFDSVKDFTKPQIRFEINNLDELHSEFVRAGVLDNQEIRETPWGTREFAFFDPIMVGLTFYESRKLYQ